MTSTPISVFLLDLWMDLHDINLLWQAGTLIACIVLGWAAARTLRGAFAMPDASQSVMRLGVGSFYHVLSPLITLILVAIAKPILALWHHVNLLRVAIPLIASFALIRLVFYILRRVFARGGSASNFLLVFEKGFATLVWLGVALYMTGLWPDLLKFLEGAVFPVGRHKVSLTDVLQALVFVVITLILALWVGAMLEDRLMRIDTMHTSLRVVLARMGRALLIMVAVLVSLSLVGIDITVLSVFGGALGVGIGLGLQKIVSSYVSGFVILLERSLKIGDMVTVDKYSGEVTQINTRYTVLRGSDGVESVIPNEMLVSSPLQNYSLTDRTVRLVTHVTVDYQTDIDQLFPMLEQVVAAVPRVSNEPPPQVFLLKFGADGLELEMGFWILDPENGRLSILSDVNKALWQALQTHNITVPYPQREVRLIGERAGNQDSPSPKPAA